jgi:hypothetical protein
MFIEFTLYFVDKISRRTFYEPISMFELGICERGGIFSCVIEPNTFFAIYGRVNF